MAIKTRPDELAIRVHILWYGAMTNMLEVRAALVDIAKKHSGMRPVDSPEFKEAQKEWWYLYTQLTILRAFVLRYFNIRGPNWKELLPDRKYCGVLLSEEDFIKFVTQEGSGMVLQKPESEESYAEDLKANRKARRVQNKALLEGDDAASEAEEDDENETP